LSASDLLLAALAESVGLRVLSQDLEADCRLLHRELGKMPGTFREALAILSTEQEIWIVQRKWMKGKKIDAEKVRAEIEANSHRAL
jgi:hypothetical protein